MTIVGLDIGGANLKAADGLGRAEQVPFALWKHPERLDREIGALLTRFGKVHSLAVTMTGELCDCFETKSAGVYAILAAVERAASKTPTSFWTIDGRFIPAEELRAQPLKAAAANWLALATFAGRLLPCGPGLLIDLGSTTCDIIPLEGGQPHPQGRTDPERFASGELVYCGVRRTPLCAVFGLMKAAELFATTADAFVVLGDLPEEPNAADSADGRPMTKPFAQARLARMECDEAWSLGRTLTFAEHVRTLLVKRIAESVTAVAGRLPGPAAGVVLAGAGEFLLPMVLDVAGIDAAQRISLGERLGPALSTSACAHAVAVLARERP